MQYNMNKTMMLINSKWNGKDSFSLIPITIECPYVECIYDPIEKKLVVIGKQMKESFMMLPLLDRGGNTIPFKANKNSEQTCEKKREKLYTFYEYYINN